MDGATALRHLYGWWAFGCIDHLPVLLHDVNLVGVEFPDVPAYEAVARAWGLRLLTLSLHGSCYAIVMMHWRMQNGRWHQLTQQAGERSQY
jgi:hypothetical protein